MGDARKERVKCDTLIGAGPPHGIRWGQHGLDQGPLLVGNIGLRDVVGALVPVACGRVPGHVHRPHAPDKPVVRAAHRRMDIILARGHNTELYSPPVDLRNRLSYIIPQVKRFET